VSPPYVNKPVFDAEIVPTPASVTAFALVVVTMEAAPVNRSAIGSNLRATIRAVANEHQIPGRCVHRGGGRIEQLDAIG
jgi:hypothetical protein